MKNAGRNQGASLILASALLVSVCPVVAQEAEDWKAQLDTPVNGNVRGPVDSVVIRLPQLPVEVLEKLALELDDVDVTSCVQPAPDALSASFTPLTPLSPGAHRLRLLQSAEGRLVSRGQWDIQINPANHSPSGKFNAGATIEGSGRFAESDDANQPGRFQSTGSTRFKAGVYGERVKHEGNVDLMLDTNYEKTAGRRPVDIGQYLLTSESSNHLVRVGHHAAAGVGLDPSQDLVYDASSRRGLSVGAGWNGYFPTDITGYVFRTNSITGFEHGLGIGDPDNRIQGVRLDARPYEDASSQFDVAVNLLSGQGQSSGVGVGAYDAVGNAGFDGNAADYMVDSRWLERRLQLRGERSHTRLKLPLTGSVNDDASSYLIGYQPAKGILLPWSDHEYLDWRAALRHFKYGSFYRSVAYLGAPVDVQGDQLNLGFQTGSVNGDIAVNDAKDNVNGLPLATTETRSIVETLGWAPGISPTAGPAFLRQPIFGLTVSGERRRTTDMPSSSFVSPLDMRTRAFRLSSMFQHPLGNWGLSYGPTFTDDETGVTQDSRHDVTSADASFRFMEWWQLSCNATYDDMRTHGSPGTRTLNRVLNNQFSIIPGWWDLNFSITDMHIRSGDALQRASSKSFDLTNTWRFPVISLWMRGSYLQTQVSGVQRFIDPNSGLVVEAFVPSGGRHYQIMTGLTLSAPKNR